MSLHLAAELGAFEVVAFLWNGIWNFLRRVLNLNEIRIIGKCLDLLRWIVSGQLENDKLNKLEYI